MKHLITMKDGTEICTGDYVDYVTKVVHRADHPTTPPGGITYIGARADLEDDCRKCMATYNNDPMALTMHLGRIGHGITLGTSYGDEVARTLEERVAIYNTQDLGACVIVLGPIAGQMVSTEHLAELAERE